MSRDFENATIETLAIQMDALLELLRERLPELQAKSVPEPFGYYDNFNECFYRDIGCAQEAANGGNLVRVLFVDGILLPKKKVKKTLDRLAGL
jgi:hypothetical protein